MSIANSVLIHAQPAVCLELNGVVHKVVFLSICTFCMWENVYDRCALRRSMFFLSLYTACLQPSLFSACEVNLCCVEAMLVCVCGACDALCMEEQPVLLCMHLCL